MWIVSEQRISLSFYPSKGWGDEKQQVRKNDHCIIWNADIISPGMMGDSRSKESRFPAFRRGFACPFHCSRRSSNERITLSKIAS